MTNYDVIMALSTLHWLLQNPPEGSSQFGIDMGKRYFEEIMNLLWGRTKYDFIIEMPLYVLKMSEKEFVKMLNNLLIPTPKAIKVLGISDANRPVVRCSKIRREE